MYEIQPDQKRFVRVSRALREEADGAIIARAVEDLRAAASPAVGLVRSAIASSGGGLPHAGESIRAAIAAGVHESVNIRKRSGRVSVLAMKTGMPRKFKNAPKRFNEPSFRRRVYGSNRWVVQVGAPGWFDDTLQANPEKYRPAVRRALEDTADNIARKA